MSKSDLRRFLDDEFAALEGQIRQLEAEARSFWHSPASACLAVWGQVPIMDEPPDPSPGTLSERELYSQLVNSVRPALESRRHGFDTVPVLYPHDKHYRGPPFRTHFLAVVMGAEVHYPADVPVEERKGYRAWVDPLIGDASDISALEDVDVSKSPALQAVLRSCEEMGEIVQGRMAFGHYSPTLPLDFAAEVIGPIGFYELVASEPESAARLLEVCTGKWLEMMRLQEKVVGDRWANAVYEPGISVHDMILPFLSPASIRQVVVPYNAMLSDAYGGIVVRVNHPDAALLDDYLELPGLLGLSMHEDWPAEPVVEALKDRAVLKARYDWHFHCGKEKEAPVCLPWEECCQLMSQFAGRLRVQASVTGWGKTPREKLECILGDLGDLRRIWREHVEH